MLIKRRVRPSQYQIKVHEISSWQEANCTPVVSRSFEHHVGDNTLCFGSTPVSRAPWIGQRPTNSTTGLRLDGYLEYPHAAKALYIYRYPCHLLNSNTGPNTPQSASQTTVLNGWLI
ncbi:uncharacterized protein TNCV_3418321 [Trichonephila clavipes]|nr:uncharacterized protein TNCV_3418321 [Trichonephila clavipes]